MSAPSVSIIVPVLNGVSTIEPCLESLVAMDYPAARRQIIVVDNGSTDGTIQRLDAWRPRIAVEHEARRGPAAARNRGLAVAAGDVVAFTDADCVVDPGWLRALVAPLDQPQVAVAGGRILPLEPCGDIERFGATIHDHQEAIERGRPAYAITMNWASRRDVLTAIGGFDETFRRCEDVDLAYRLQRSGYTIVYVAEAVVYHRNETTLGGLFDEGFAHGFHSVHALKTHNDFVRPFGHRAINRASYAALAGTCARAFRQGGTAERCACLFGVGKKLGKIAGSVRYAHVDL